MYDLAALTKRADANVDVLKNSDAHNSLFASALNAIITQPTAVLMLIIPGYISCAFQAGLELGRKQMAMEIMLKGGNDEP